MVIAYLPRFYRCADAALASNCMVPTKDINNLAGFGHNHFRPWPQRSKINRPQSMNQNHGNSGSSLPACRSVDVVCISEISENNFATTNETWCVTHSPTSRRRISLNWVRFLYTSAAAEAAIRPWHYTNKDSCPIIRFRFMHQYLKNSSYCNGSSC
jgi:hypothetical protein